MDVSSHYIEAETSEVEADMSAAVVRVPYAHVLIVGTTLTVTMEQGSGVTSRENCLVVNKGMPVAYLGVQ